MAPATVSLPGRPETRKVARRVRGSPLDTTSSPLYACVPGEPCGVETGTLPPSIPDLSLDSVQTQRLSAAVPRRPPNSGLIRVRLLGPKQNSWLIRVRFSAGVARDGHVKLLKCAGPQIVADALTKSLPRPALSKHRQYMWGTRIPFSAFYFSLKTGRPPTTSYNIITPCGYQLARAAREIYPRCVHLCVCVCCVSI